MDHSLKDDQDESMDLETINYIKKPTDLVMYESFVREVYQNIIIDDLDKY